VNELFTPGSTGNACSTEEGSIVVVVVDELLVDDVDEVLDVGRELDVAPMLVTGADSVVDPGAGSGALVLALVEGVIQLPERAAASSSSPDEHAAPSNTRTPPIARSRTTQRTRGGTAENTSAL